MSLWAMGDFHLNFSQPERSMDPYGKVWVNHEKKIFMNSQKMISPEDTFVVTGDHGWGRRINSCQPDMDFIASLPGRKILLRGNHDMFWNTKKTKQLNEFFNPRLYFLQDNFYSYQAADGKEYALCGTKGICFENLTTYEQFLKLLDRETQRMEKSVGEAWQATATLYYSCTIHQQRLGKAQALLQKLQKELVRAMWYIHTAMGKPDSMTAYRARSEE